MKVIILLKFKQDLLNLETVSNILDHKYQYSLLISHNELLFLNHNRKIRKKLK